MKLDISYAKPCGERNKLTARVTLSRIIDIEKLREKCGGSFSKNLNLVKLRINKTDVMVYEDHIDIRNADKEYQILKIVDDLRRFTGIS
jgi:hypothetical protein